MFIPPFKVHVCWFASKNADSRCAAIGRELYEFMHRPIDDDVVQRPGLEIPVEVGRDLEDLLTALERVSTAADGEPPVGVRLTIAIVDQASHNSDRHRLAVERALERARSRRVEEVFLPIVLAPSWYGVLADGVTSMTTAISVKGPSPDETPLRWGILSDVAVVAGRALLRRLGDANPPKPRVFLSHAKADGAALTEELVAHFRTETRVDAWYDATDVHAGEALGRQLEQAASDGVVLVVRTDRYSESPWCAMELLAAKRAGVPIVTLLATDDGEPRASAYGGNHRTMNWKSGREREVVARCVQAWLHGHHFRAHAAAALARAGLPSDSEIVSRRPELLDVAVVPSKSPLLVHPDPPLTEGEASLLRTARPALRIGTPNTLLGRVMLAHDPEPPLSGTAMALSLSVAEDLPRLEDGAVGSGLTQGHLDDALYAIVLATLHSGARIGYGGDFRTHDGYAKKLSDLHRSRRRLGTGRHSQLICFLDDSQREGDAAEEMEFWPVPVEAPIGASDFGPGVRSVLWHLAMREEMASRCEARILLGGKFRPTEKQGDGGYVGPWPGVLEEAWRTLRAGKALYVVGGFGGVAGVIARMLTTGVIPPIFAAAAHRGKPLEKLASEVDAARAVLAERADPAVLLANAAGGFDGIEQLAEHVLQRWQRFQNGERDAWPNGLDFAENERIFRSTDPTEITHVVFEGLRRITRRPGGELKLALYHGDIAAVPNVDGYAVAVTPGVPEKGAYESLSSRTGLSLTDSIKRSPRIALATAKSSDLAGSHMLVARLDLPAPGMPMGDKVIEEIAEEVAREADALGIHSMACVPFGTTLGVSPADATRAMVAGIARGRGTFPALLVLCETDRVRYREVRTALGDLGDVFELHAGPAAARGRTGMVLHVSADEPSEERDGRFLCTLFLPEDRDAVVPLHDSTMTLAQWNSFRGDLAEFPETLGRGQSLWRELLSPEIRSLLSEHADKRISLLTDDTAAGLPWELLTDDKGVSPALTGGVVRRIALRGGARPPSRAATDARLRILLVVDSMRNLPGCRHEADRIQRVLAGRADVDITRLDGAAATLKVVSKELRDGHYDVLHCAGHAWFDENAPDRSGVRLADATLSAAHLSSAAPPRLVFLSACRSSRVRRDGVDAAETPAPAILPQQGRSLAEGFLRAGVSTLIGTFVSVWDEPAREFADRFYTIVAAGQPLGAAMREGRKRLHEKQEPDWGNFVLYGDDEMIL
jgi:hypothetical protein